MYRSAGSGQQHLPRQRGLAGARDDCRPAQQRLRSERVRQRRSAPADPNDRSHSDAVMRTKPREPRLELARPALKEEGFSIVELMIALTLGLILVTVLVSALTANSAGRAELDKSSQQIESGRYALQLLSQ